MTSRLNIEPIENWLPSSNYPLIISGPCSAESEEQVIITARELSKIPNIKLFRAGIWKPRTRPNLFEGVGDIGLEWLNRVQNEIGLKVAVEVANPYHIEKCLKKSIDVIWIGARTVVNPFSIQEISESLKGVDIPVMVKNPLNPDINLWIGAIERLNKSGITKIVAVHRGFYLHGISPYRNQPMWEIPIELKRLFPEIPVICDPSHIAGKSGLIFSVSQKALDLLVDGLMIESHFDPLNALTDKEQQISPKTLKLILKKLVVRYEKVTEDISDVIEILRKEIDSIDHELIEILARRMLVVNQLGKYKKDKNISILQMDRWKTIICDRLEYAKYRGLDKEFVLKLLQQIHKESIRIQTEIFTEKK